MATSPNDLAARHRREAAAAAALIALGKLSARYSLPSLVRQTGKKPRPFRRIAPTQALAGSIAAPHLSIAAAWAAERDHLLAAYGINNATMLRQVDLSATRVATTVAIAKHRFAPAMSRLEQWHRGQWLQRVKTTTGLDVGMLTTAGDVQPEIANAVAWNQQLAEDVHQQTKGRVASALMVALVAGAPLIDARRAIDDAVAKAKRRAAAIGVDQTEKTSGGMTRARMTAAGVDQWRWRHLDGQKHPRLEHEARDGNLYSDENQPSEMPGQLPFCHCWTEPVLG